MQTKKYIDKLVGQSDLLGRWWGNLQTIAQHTNIYIQFLILCFSGTSAYAVLSTALHEWGYQLAFWQFALGVVFLIGVMGLFAWRFSIPSTFETWNFQWWYHGNFAKPIIEQLQADNIQFKADNNQLKKDNEEIKGMLSQLLKERDENKRVS